MATVDALIKAIVKLVREEAAKFTAGQSFESAYQEYRNELALTMLEYLDSKRPITAFRNQYKRATNDAFTIVAYAGWADGGGTGELPVTLVSWLNGQIDRQMGYIDQVFEQMRDLRNSGDKEAQSKFVGDRADGYASTLNGIYNRAKMEGSKYELGEWEYGDTDHCRSCESLHGTIRPLKWFIDNRYIPQENGSQTLECGGWNCQCRIVDPETRKQLVP